MLDLKQRKKIEQIEKMRQSQSINVKDDYSAGFYNGLELAMSILDGREPEYMTAINNPDVVDCEEKSGRTMASGVIKRR